MHQFPPAPSGCYVLDLPAELSRIIVSVRGSYFVFAVTLCQGTQAGEIKPVVLVPGGRVPVRLLDHAARTTVIVAMGDPKAGNAFGPGKFPRIRRLLAWATAQVVRAAGRKVIHCETVVYAARLRRRVLLIESPAAKEDTWLESVVAELERARATGRPLAALVISAVARDGLHPVSSERAN